MSQRMRGRSWCASGVLACAVLALANAAAYAQSTGSDTHRLDGRSVIVPDFAHVSRSQLRQLPARGPLQPVQWPSAGRDATARPRALVPLYAGFATLQALDAHSTLRAIGDGHGERNPVVSNFTAAPGAMVGLKLASTAGTIYLAERLWRKHRGAAVVLMIAVNGAYAAVVAHNYRVR
jgi:hypothetical protein